PAPNVRRRGEADRLDPTGVERREVEVVGAGVVEDARVAFAAFVERVSGGRQGQHRAALSGPGDLRPGAPVGRSGFSQPRLEVATARAPIEAHELRVSSGW